MSRLVDLVGSYFNFEKYNIKIMEENNKMYDNIPLLTPSDVQLRIAQLQTTSYGTYVNLLCYKDSRVDMRLLDSVFGPLNWKKEHIMLGENIFCTISVYDPEKKEWIPKTDVGTETNTEATKGAVSDSMKRSAVLWGIGRELYAAPQIRFKLNENETIVGANGKPKCYTHFHVGKMKFNKEENRFDEFEVLDDQGNIRWSLSKAQVTSNTIAKPKVIDIQQDAQVPTITESNNRCEGCGAVIRSPKVVEYSRQRFKKVLCYKCQGNHFKQTMAA